MARAWTLQPLLGRKVARARTPRPLVGRKVAGGRTLRGLAGLEMAGERWREGLAGVKVAGEGSLRGLAGRTGARGGERREKVIPSDCTKRVWATWLTATSCRTLYAPAFGRTRLFPVIGKVPVLNFQ